MSRPGNKLQKVVNSSNRETPVKSLSRGRHLYPATLPESGTWSSGQANRIAQSSG
jgi:hypothetical protein